jgi:hypothetical protein
LLFVLFADERFAPLADERFAELVAADERFAAGAVRLELRLADERFAAGAVRLELRLADERFADESARLELLAPDRPAVLADDEELAELVLLRRLRVLVSAIFNHLVFRRDTVLPRWIRHSGIAVARDLQPLEQITLPHLAFLVADPVSALVEFELDQLALDSVFVV